MERQINEIGLTPDYVVELTEDDFLAERDTQLEKRSSCPERLVEE
jgi:hypothetical protein